MKIQINIADYEQESMGFLPLLLEHISIMRKEFEVDVFIDNTIKKQYQIPVYQEAYPLEVKYELPWKCRKRMLSSIEDYDLFIYTDKDMMITSNHINNFLKLDAKGKYAKLLRYEMHDNQRTLPDVHIPEEKFRIIDNNLLITNVHQGCFILTRFQLKKWISFCDIEKVKVISHKGVYYHILETAASQPFIENDLNFTIEIDNIHDHLIYHAGNNYPHFNMTLEKMGIKDIL